VQIQQWMYTYLGVEDPVALLNTGVRIILIIIGFNLAIRFTYIVIDRTFSVAGRRLEDGGEQRRLETIQNVLKSAARYALNFLALTTLLPLLGIPIAQLIAGAGVLGLALGFGAQTLVRDIISGFFFLHENHFTVGDYVVTGNFSGIVESVGMRVTQIRDFGGQLHYLPNGTITEITNYSRGDMRALVDVDVAYEEDVDRVVDLLEQFCEVMAEEIPQVTEVPSVMGVQSFNDSSVTIRLRAVTENMQQWDVERRMRRMIKQYFEETDIEIPYPRCVVVPPSLTKMNEREEFTSYHE